MAIPKWPQGPFRAGAGPDQTAVLTPPYPRVPTDDDTNLPMVATTHLSSAQILALFATPIDITPAPPVGYYILPLSVVATYHFVTTPYADDGAGNKLHISTNQEYNIEVNGGEWGEIARVDILRQAISMSSLMLPSDDVSLPGINGHPLAVLVNAAQTIGDGTLTMQVVYIVLPITPT